MSADALIAEVVTDKGKLLLHGARCQGKHQLIVAYAVAQAEIIKILIDTMPGAIECVILWQRSARQRANKSGSSALH